MVKNSIFIFFLFFSSVAYAYQFKGDWELINADRTELYVKSNSNRVVFSGNVYIKNGKNSFKAQKIVYYEKERKIELSTELSVYINDTFITAERAIYFVDEEKANFYENVVISRNSFKMTGKRAVFYAKNSNFVIDGNVYFSQKRYNGFSEKFFYYDKEEKVVLKGFALIVLDKNYISADKIEMNLIDEKHIKELFLTRAVDIYAVGKEKLYLRSQKAHITFVKNNELKEVDALYDVTSDIYGEKERNHIDCERMKIFFKNEKIKNFVILGNPRGRRIIYEEEKK